jgi:hypothetical protein
MATANERALLDHAERHLGLFTRRHARSLDVPDHVIERRLASGHWELTQPATIRVVGAPLTYEADVYAAVLSAQNQANGERKRIAAASYGTAARLLGLSSYASDADDDPVEITVTGTALPELWWDTVVHRTVDLPSSDIIEIGPVPCTTGARFAVDKASHLDLVDVYSMADDVIGARLCTQCELHRRAKALRKGRRNVAALQDVTAPGAAAEFRSWLERTAAARFHEGGLPAPEWNVPIMVNGSTVALVDALWRAAKVVVEVDGLRFHEQPGQVARDKARDRKLAIMGFLVLRYTYREIVDTPDIVVAQIREALADRGGLARA